MPIPNLTDETPINQYTANSGETEFAFTFYIFALSDIKVYANDVLKTITTDYVVRKNDGNVIGDADLPMDGGKIIFNVGRTAGEKISLNRDIPVDRSTQFSTGGAFKADSLNSELTRILTIAQQLKRDIARSFRLAPSDAEGGSLQLPTDRADNFLAFDSNSNLILTKFADFDKANVSPFIATLLDDVSASIARDTLGLAIGTNVQAQNANLTALAGLNGSANKSFYFDGVGSLVLADRLGTTTNRGVAFLPKDILISNNVGTPNSKIDFSDGVMIFDDGSGAINSSAMTGDLANLFGTSDGMLDTGTKANTSDYSLFAVYNPTTGIIKPLASLSRTAPTMPSGFTKKEYRGKILTDESGNIIAFVQRKDNIDLTGTYPFKQFSANPTTFTDINFATNYCKDVVQNINIRIQAVEGITTSWFYYRAKNTSNNGIILSSGEENSGGVNCYTFWLMDVLADSTGTWQYRSHTSNSWRTDTGRGFYLTGWNDTNLKIRG